MIVLPKGAFMVLQDEPIEKENKSGIILSAKPEKEKKPNTGVIVYTSEELNKYQLCRVVFRENFGEEEIEVNGKKYIFFRDFNSQIYYVITDEDKG